MTTPDDGEQRIRSWLRRKIDGPAEDEQPQPLVEVHVIPEPAAAAEDDEDQNYEEPEAQPEPPWWSYALPGPFGARRTLDPEPDPHQTLAAAPGVHVTVNQPPPQQWAPPPSENTAAQGRRRRRQLWLAYHGSAAAVGWWTGLADLMADLLADAGPSAPAAGVALGLVTYVIASYLPGLPYMPPALRPVMVWVARIPVCTAALALCLNAPGNF
ncbi:hypothetical protein [Streptomyces sp. NPDC014685]|uniref:hypothetical protein n=1 Tax=Streptomyces sp. NPDC014685 TaxID=3364881 RepID=UPI0036FE9F7A